MISFLRKHCPFQKYNVLKGNDVQLGSIGLRPIWYRSAIWNVILTLLEKRPSVPGVLPNLLQRFIENFVFRRVYREIMFYAIHAFVRD